MQEKVLFNAFDDWKMQESLQVFFVQCAQKTGVEGGKRLCYNGDNPWNESSLKEEEYMKRLLMAFLCIVLMLSCALAEETVDSLAANAPYEGEWIDLGVGYEVYLPADWEVIAEGSYYDFNAYALDYTNNYSYALSLKVLEGTYESIEQLMSRYVMLRPELIEVNGIQIVDQLKNVAEAYNAGVYNWGLLLDDGRSCLMEMQVKNEVSDEINPEQRALCEYILSTLRKIEAE